MADEPFGNQNWPPQPGGQDSPLGTGEGEAPLATPPNPKIDLRTMASDLNSLKETGGGAPRPYTPEPTISPKPEEKPTPAPAPSFEPAKIGGVETPAPFPTVVPAAKSKKGLFWGLVVLIVVVGLAATGYFFVYPKYFATPAVTENLPETPASIPAPTTPPPAETPTPSGETAVPATPPLPETPPQTLLSHVSLFKTPADLVSDVTLASNDLASFQAALPATTTDVPVLKEIVLRDAQNNILALTPVVSLFLAGDFSTDILNGFNNDVTAFVYTDKNGTWPGLILSASQNANLADLQPKTNQALEASIRLSNFFLVSPGVAGSTWKTGSTSGVTNRYLNFENAGFALNYAWAGQNLVISSSYDGFKEVLRRLQ